MFQTYGQTDRKSDTVRQTVRQTDSQTDRKSDTVRQQIYGCMEHLLYWRVILDIRSLSRKAFVLPVH